MSHTVSSEHQSDSNVLGKTVASKGLHLLSHIVLVKMAALRGLYYILLQSRWRRQVVCICLSHIVADDMAAPNGLHMAHTVSSEHQSVSSVLGKMVASKGQLLLSHIVLVKIAAPLGLHLFVTSCCRQDGGATWSVFVCHIILQARWRHHVVCICLLHMFVGKMAAPRGLHLFVI
jgi:hypothetical protein